MTLSEWYKAGNHLPNMAKGGKAKKSTRRVSDDPIGDFLNDYEMEKLTKGIAELDAKIKDLEPVPTQVETGSDPMLLNVYPRLKREMEADPHLYEYGTADKKDPSFRRPMLRKPAGRPDDVIPDRLDNDWLEYQLRPRGQTDFSDKLPPGMELPIGKVRSLLEDPSEYYAKGGEVSGPKGFGLADVAPFVSPVSMKTGGKARTRAGTIAKPTFIDEQLGRTSERLSKLATDPQQAMRDIAAQYFPSPTDSPEEQQRKLEELTLGFTGNIKPVGGATNKIFYRGSTADEKVLRPSSGHEHGVSGISTSPNKEFAGKHGNYIKSYSAKPGEFVDFFDLVKMYDKSFGEDAFLNATDKSVAEFAKSKGYIGSYFDDPFGGEDYRFFDASSLKPVKPDINKAQGGLAHMANGGQGRTRAGTIAKPTFIDEQIDRTRERLSKLYNDPDQALRDIAQQYFPSAADTPEEQQQKLEDLALGFTGNIKPVGGISATAAKAAKGKKAAPAAPTAEEARATASAGLSPEESKLVEMFGNKQKREAELTRKVKKQAQAEPKVKGESKGKRSAVQPDFYRKMQEDLGEEAVLRDIRSGQHLKQDPYGGYIGAPRTVSSPQALGGMRKSLDQQFQDAVQGLKIADPERMGTWYDRAKAGIAQSTEPFQLPRVLEEHGVYSAGVAPESELGFALKHRNSRAVGQPEMAYRGAPMRTLDTAVAQDRPAKMGFKIGEYANKNDPRIPNTGLFGVNDFRAAQGFGYTTPAGDIWTGGVSPTMHPFMDAETALVVDRANKAAIGGRSDWQGPHIQELPWVLGKAQDLYSRGKTGRFAGEPIEGISAALREANKTAQDYMYKHAAAGTHEAIPGQSTGHVPGMLSATPEEKIAYSQEGRWDQPTPYTLLEAPTVGAGNRDVLYSALNMRQLPSEPSVGAYRNMAGEYEFNPMTMARPLLDFPTGGKGLVAPQTLKTANAVERFRAIMDAQEAGALNLPNTMGAVKGKNSIVLDSRGVNKADPSLGVQPTQEQMITLNKELEGTGYGASATGRGVTIFPFNAEQMGSKEIQSLIKKKGADFQRIFPSKVEKSLNSFVYVPGIGKWGDEGIVPTTPFSGEATSGFLKEIAGLPPKVALDIGESEGVRGSIRKKIARDAPLPGAREDIQNMRKFFAEADWPKAVALIRKGLTPAAALASMGYSLESMAGEKEPLR